MTLLTLWPIAHVHISSIVDKYGQIKCLSTFFGLSVLLFTHIHHKIVLFQTVCVIQLHEAHVTGQNSY